MTSERLIPRAITPMKQSLEASCVPTAISMVFSGFGIDISEQTLVDRYFQTAKLPASDLNRGVSNTDTVKGIVQIIEDQDLKEKLQLDVFIPELYKYTRSHMERYIVEAEPKALRRYEKVFKKGSEIRNFFKTLEQLSREGEIGVYTANARMLQFPKRSNFSWMVPQASLRGFYDELSDFISKGHIVGSHGGMTMHTRALDGSRMEKLTYRPDEVGYVIVDPRGENYAVSLHSLVMVDSVGVRGDVFDYLFRVSSKAEGLNPQNYGFRGFLQNLRNLIP